MLTVPLPGLVVAAQTPHGRRELAGIMPGHMPLSYHESGSPVQGQPYLFDLLSGLFGFFMRLEAGANLDALAA